MATTVPWTAQYNFGQAPEQQNFTRSVYGATAVVKVNSTGPTANRNLTVTESDANSGVAFLTSSIPSFDATRGATAEATVAVTGAGDAGFEVTFLDHAFGLNIATSGLILDVDGAPEQVVATASNAGATTFRITIDATATLNVYRAGVRVAGPIALPVVAHPFQRFLFWGESGGAQVFTALAYYIGGAVAP